MMASAALLVLGVGALVTGEIMKSRSALLPGMICIGLAFLVQPMILFRRWKLRRERRSIHEPPPYTCPGCGYALRGSTGVACPECGTIRPRRLTGQEGA